MTAIASAQERRTENVHEWIQNICQRFTDATGWPMFYRPMRSNEMSRVQAALEADPTCCWHHEVNDSQRRLGYLSIHLPDHPGIDRSFGPACELAGSIADLLSRLSGSKLQLDTRTRELSTLVDLGLSVPQEDDLLDALKQLLRASVQLTSFRSSGFFLLDPGANELNLRVSHNLDAMQIPHPTRCLSDDPPDITALVRGTAFIQRDTHPELKDWLPPGTAVGLCVAVQSESGPIGTLWAYDRRARLPSDRETHVLGALAAQIAAVLERVVLLRESETQHRLQRELKVVSDHHTHTLVDPLPPASALDAAACIRTAYELGGDLCELIPIDEKRTAIAIGDASGDGIPAAVVMTTVRGALRAVLAGTLEDSLNVELVTSRINQALHAVTPAHQFMSFVYGVVDAEAMTYTYTNAGHPLPILMRDGETVSLESHGMLLGVTPDAEYRHSVVPLESDDLLVMFSDGIVEAMNRTRQMFRSDGVIAAIKNRADGCAQDILQAIWRCYETHSAGGSHPDDRTLLVMRVLNPNP
jgi:phosphoserine phosphatase RsbU/P